MGEDYAALADAGLVWVAENEGVLVGLLVLKVESDHILLDNVAVSPDAQGLGVGGQLLAFTDDQARALGLAEVRLCTNVTMTENIAYYGRRGFVETHRATDRGYHRVYFTKRL
jgi:N-acetylglutamate synthase-like GNAT family acetyltransferase